MFWILFIVFLAACMGAGATGAAFKPGAWYQSLDKPSWTPPDWAFPVVWTTLYIFMAVAGARAALLPDNSLAMAFWALQIALNCLWTPVFFGLHRIREGMLVLSCLWIAVAAAMIALFQIDTIAGLLFVPYLIWVTTAGALNLSVWQRNPQEARNPQTPS